MYQVQMYLHNYSDLTNSGSITGDMSDAMEQTQSLKECFPLTK